MTGKTGNDRKIQIQRDLNVGNDFVAGDKVAGDKIINVYPPLHKALPRYFWPALVSTFFTFLLIGIIAVYGMNRGPGRMEGTFRIAIAGFDVKGKPQNPDIGRELAHEIALRLQISSVELAPDLIITIWGPDKVGEVEGNTAEERSLSAYQISEDIGADLVIYGIVDTTTPLWSVSPEFYISDHNFYQALEILGEHQLGQKFSFPGEGDLTSRIKISKELDIRIQVLSRIAVGLAHYALLDFDNALKTLQSAENIGGWEVDQGKEVLYVLIGNAAARLEQLELADTYFQKALSIDQEYARPYIGLGNIYYLRALQNFEKSNNPVDIDQDFLDQAILHYSKAVRAGNQSIVSDIGAKVQFGMGQCYFARTYSGKDKTFNAAITAFSAVIQEYTAGRNPRVRVLAAESHARLGLIYDLSGYLDQAVKEYEAASSLWHDNAVRSALFKQRADKIKDRNVLPTP